MWTIKTSMHTIWSITVIILSIHSIYALLQRHSTEDGFRSTIVALSYIALVLVPLLLVVFYWWLKRNRNLGLWTSALLYFLSSIICLGIWILSVGGVNVEGGEEGELFFDLLYYSLFAQLFLITCLIVTFLCSKKDMGQ